MAAEDSKAAPNLLAQLTGAVLNNTLRGEMVGTGTLIDPRIVVVPIHTIRDTKDAYQVNFEDPNIGIVAKVRAVDPTLGIAILELAEYRDIDIWAAVITFDDQCRASWFTNDHRRHEAEGLVLRREQDEWVIQLDVSSVIGGGPVVIGGALVGMLTGLAQAGEAFRVLPIDAITGRVQKSMSAPEQPDAVAVEAPFDFAPLLARMTADAQRTLRLAEAIRRQTRKRDGTPVQHLHCEHVVLALSKTSNTIAKLLASKKISDDQLIAAMQESAKTKFSIPDAAPDAVTFTTPTGHLEKAFATATRAAGRDDIGKIHLFYGILSTPECSTQRALVALGIVPSDIHLPRPSTQATQISGFQADNARGTDLFNLEKEVRALCSVIAAKDVKPPISVGLFGEWGSGKSFFMAQMEEELKRIAKDEDPEMYCTEIIQLWFNAWHYSDSNLWASLTSEIFNGLDRELHLRDKNHTPETYDAKRARTLKELADAKELQLQKEAKAQKAETELHAAEEQLRSAADAKTAEKSLHFRTILWLVPHVLFEQKEVKKKVEAAKNAVSQAAAEAGLDEADVARLSPTFAQAKALFLELRKKDSWRFGTLAVVLLVIGGVAAARYVDIHAIYVSAAAFVGYAAVLNKPLQKIAAIFKPARDALKEARKVLNEQADEQGKAAEEKRRAAEAEAVEARAAAQQAAEDVTTKEKELADNEPERKFATFVQQRQQSDDYRKQLGVIALAHNDFRELSTLLADALEHAAAENPIQRIVLYIDDLDRCPEKKVMDVLQAVHLLLAFPLFVVIVGVDSRWLLHSVQQHSKAFTPDSSEQSNPEWAHWRSTPLNYLEKIFQIPLTLRPMQLKGFENLVDRLVTKENKSEPKQKTPDANAGDGATTDGGAQSGENIEKKEDPTAGRTAGKTAGTGTATSPPTRKPSEYLQITSDEGAFMKNLFPLMPSPRAAKRFVNVYRLIRAKQDSALRKRDYEPLLLLLAILTGYPVEATYLLQGLMNEKVAKGGWPEFVRGLALPDTLDGAEIPEDWQPAHWEKLKKLLTKVHETCGIADGFDIGPFVEWAPEVARYSFHTGRILAPAR